MSPWPGQGPPLNLGLLPPFQRTKFGTKLRGIVNVSLSAHSTLHNKIPCHRLQSEAAMEDFFDNWRVQVRKGVLELCIMTALGDGERYGYELVKNLVAVPGVQVAEGSIYPLMTRLKRQGFVDTRLVESSEGPARKYYSLTPAGRKQAKAMRAYFGSLVEGMGKLNHGANGKA